MHGYGRWLQLSIFHCRLDGGRRAEMAMALERLIELQVEMEAIVAAALNASGLLFIEMAKAGGWKQSTVATILDITPGAVSQHFNR